MFNAISRCQFLRLSLSLLTLALAVPFVAQAQINETVLWTFGAAGDGFAPTGLIFDSHGNLFGTTESGGAHGWGAAFELSPPSSGSGPWTETLLYSFCSVGDCTDGGYPSAGLVFDSQGNLYGTTSYGGATSNFNYGVVFELSPPLGGTGPWTETVLHSFCTLSECADGVKAAGGLILDSKGNLYGATTLGGLASCTYSSEFPGCGLVYELSPPGGGIGPWTENVLWSFGATPADGEVPGAGVILDSQGNLYGTTETGGMKSAGVVFELSPPGGGIGPWTENLLWTFGGAGDGGQSVAGLIFDSQGNLYGTAYGGDEVFELSPPGGGTGPWTEAVLYHFCSASGCADGSSPYAGLIFDSHGNLYGTTSEGGNAPLCPYLGGCGTAFELSPPGGGTGPWTENVLWSFAAGSQGKYEGADPYFAGLIFDPLGNLYGITQYGGNYSSSPDGKGVVFELTPCTNPAVSLASSANPSTGGQTVGFTATVSPFPTYTLGLGSVSFKANGSTIGTIGLLTANDGAAILHYPNLGASGTPISMVAIYNPAPGSPQCGNTSPALLQTVNAEPTTTILGVTNPTTAWGQATGLNVLVESTNGITPTGTVAYKNGGTLLGNVALGPAGLGAAQASLNVSSLPVGANSITANYIGSTLMQASVSAPATATVSQATSTTAITSSANPSVYGQTVSFKATALPQYGGTATGTMTFYKNGLSIGVVSLSGGQANLAVTSLTPATDIFTANYNGSANVAGSSATPEVSQVVNTAATTTVVVSTSPTVTHGTPVTFTATITSAAPSTAVPPGSVVFYDTFNSVQSELGVGTLSGGMATLTHTYAAAQEGSHSVTATYAGSAYVSASPASPAITQTVD